MILFYFLIATMPLAKHAIWGRMVNDVTVIKYVGAACLLYACLYVAAKRTVPSFFSSSQNLWFYLLYVLVVISYAAKTKGTLYGRDPLVSYTSFVLLSFCTIAVLDSAKRLHYALVVALGSVSLGSLYVLREWQMYHAIYPGFRPGWVVGDANYFALSVVICLPIGIILVSNPQPLWERLFCWSCLLLTIAALVVTASRGGFLGLSAAMVFLVWHSRRRIRNLALVAAVVAVMLIAPTSPLKRLLDPTVGDREAAEIRTILWKTGLRMFAAHPITGVGIGAFMANVKDFSDTPTPYERIAHNTYLELASETGLPGLIAFIGVLWATCRCLRRVRLATFRAGLRGLHQAALGIEAGIIGFAVSVFFVSGQYQKLFWLMVFASASLSIVSAAACQEATKPARRAAAAVKKEWRKQTAEALA